MSDKIENITLNRVSDSDIPLDGIYVIPKHIHIIDTDCFYGCANLKGIIFHDNVEQIKSNAFKSCKNLESVVLPKYLNIICAFTFNNCINLKHVVLPKNLIRIEHSAFASCSSLCSINLPDSLQYIDQYAFYNCKSLESIVIPNNVRKIDNNVFNECISLKEVVLHKYISYIGDDAFTGCSALKRIDIPSKALVYCNFMSCSSLSYVNGLTIKYFDYYPMIIKHETKIDDYIIYKAYLINDINLKYKRNFFIAYKDKFSAHGSSIKNAIEDLNYKITVNKLAKEPIYMDTLMSIEIYRALTGACSFGVKTWMNENNIKEDDKLSVRELLPILEKTRAYGLEQFKNAIKDN